MGRDPATLAEALAADAAGFLHRSMTSEIRWNLVLHRHLPVEQGAFFLLNQFAIALNAFRIVGAYALQLGLDLSTFLGL